MRFQFKTDYNQDIRLFRWGGASIFWGGLAVYAIFVAWLSNTAGEAVQPGHWMWIGIGASIAFVAAVHRQAGDALWYGLLGIIIITAPLIIGVYYVSQLTLVFIYGIAGVGLYLLLGKAGQISLGHAAFVACGAYTAGIMQAQGYDLAVIMPVAIILSAGLGIMIGLPALRMTGIYLGFATYAFAFIVEEILARADETENWAWPFNYFPSTGGNNGLMLETLKFFGYEVDDEIKLYYVSLGFLVVAIVVGLNILRSSTGRAMVAIRDSETAAQSMGVNLAVYKTMAFAISAAFAGVSGVFMANFLFFIAPESFNILMSIDLLVLVLIGGLGGMQGVMFGAIFIVILPQIISLMKDTLPGFFKGLQDVAPDALDPALGGMASFWNFPGLQMLIYGLIIILFLIYEPNGIHGWWMKFKTYFKLFPLYKAGMFKRQKSYMVSEQNK